MEGVLSDTWRGAVVCVSRGVVVAVALRVCACGSRSLDRPRGVVGDSGKGVCGLVCVVWFVWLMLGKCVDVLEVCLTA